MNRNAGATGGLLACALGALLMANALFGHEWFVGERRGLDIGGGIIDVHFCSKPDDIDRMPMGIGDLEGCYSEMYARSPLGAEAGSWFGATTHMTLMLGGGAACLLMLFSLIRGFGLNVEVVSRQQQLAFQLFDLQQSVLQVHSHPGVLGARLSVGSCVALCIAVVSAPESLSVGSGVLKFVFGALLAVGGAVVLDPQHFLSGAAAPVLETAAPRAEDAAAQPALPEEEIKVNDNPACVKCEGNTLWLEKPGRHRCQKCGLYQPLHAPGSQVDL